MPIISIGAQQPRLVPPGAVARLEYEAKIMRNPFNKRNRQLLHDNYGIQLPLIERHQQQRTVIDILVILFLLSFFHFMDHCFSRCHEISCRVKQRNH